MGFGILGPVMISPVKQAANRRNAKLSTGPRTQKGRATSSLNAWKHGLNARIPTYVLEACGSRNSALVEFVRSAGSKIVFSDLVYALAYHERVKNRRREIVDIIVELSEQEHSPPEHLLEYLEQLRRLESYERKSASRLGGLFMKCGALAKRSHAPISRK